MAHIPMTTELDLCRWRVEVTLPPKEPYLGVDKLQAQDLVLRGRKIHISDLAKHKDLHLGLATTMKIPVLFL